VIFTELRFVLLFALCWIAFFAVPRRWRSATLAAFGIVFYATFAGPGVLGVVLLLTIAAYVRAPVLLFVIVLAAVKLPDSPWIAPLGLSYLTFELIHVVVERRRGRIGEMSFTDLLAFVFFAPARIAGPIKRFPQFRDSVDAAALSGDDVYAGVLRILLGLAKKFLLADVLALTVAESEYVSSTRQAWLVVIAFGLQLYLDFSAYSDIAIGFARTLGIRLPENFNRPYLAANIREFWERWHITLSQWVRDYVFTPLGRALFGTRLRPYPAAIAAISYLATFAIVGAWHGLEPRFVLWGLYHGALLAIFNLWRRYVPPSDSRALRALGIVVTFFFVTIGWVPFFLPLEKAAHVWALMFGLAR